MCATEGGVPPLSARGLWGGMISNVAITQETDTVFLYCVGVAPMCATEGAELNVLLLSTCGQEHKLCLRTKASFVKGGVAP